ncbi:MAG: phosphatidylserine/phosphatidylglycerophosphate/cardiolipin synthase family protein [Planctomycetes bacterium]|nr:phosphatidylserine/phosphatidylglycerophosphate/cardiolipin synthase family protein [Planctomycetota bacterium]
MTLRTLFATVCLLIMVACVARAQDALEWIDLGNGVQAQAYFSPYESMDEKLIAALDLAADDSTVYMSYYSFSNSTYTKKFAELKKRGVKVKLNLWDNSVSEDRLRSDQDKGYLQIFPSAEDPSSGVIPNLRKPHSGSHDYYPASMHTKFTVVTPASGPRIVVTGSANLSNSAALANYEHLIMIRSDAIAAEFEKEWHEQRKAGEIMRDALGAGTDEFPLSLPSTWTSSNPEFKAMRSKLWDLDARTDNSDPTVQTYFSPDDGLADKLMQQLERAERSIKVAIYVIAHDGIADVLRRKAASGVDVTILANAGHEGMEGGASKQFFYGDGDYEGFIKDKNVHVVPIENELGLYSKNHHKYAIVDDQIVIGGSFNWSYIATSASDENIAVIDNAEFAARFVKDFAMILETYEPVAELFNDVDENGDGSLSPQERAGHPHARWAKDDADAPLSLDELRAYRMPFVDPAAPAEETRVLFVVEFPKGSDYMPRGYDFMVIGEHPALKAGIELKNSRSTGNNCFGSATLPAGEEVEYRLVLRKYGKPVSISDLLVTGGNASGTSGNVFSDGEARAVATNPYGLPMIVKARWSGANPVN